MQCCFFTFSALFHQPEMKIKCVSYLGHHALQRTQGWLAESILAQGIPCQATEGGLQRLRQGQQET